MELAPHSGTTSQAEQIAAGLAIAAAVAPLVSVAASSILLGAALVSVLIAYRGLKMPSGLTLPLLLFAAGTLLAVALSPDPAAGFPQVKKFYVYLILPVVFTAFRGMKDVKRLVLVWVFVSGAGALYSFWQFFSKRQHALEGGQNFYLSYLGDRTTGFMSHWMTFGAEQMVVLLVLVSALFFFRPRMHQGLFYFAGLIILLSIVLNQTRSVWLGSALGLLYLVAVWRPKALLLLPLLLPLGWFAAPRSVKERATSIYSPHGTTDSNQHRIVTARTGIEMIRHHPLIGVGPEMVSREFEQYLPADIAHPLPEGFYGHLHNVYLQYGADRGLPTLGMLLWFIAVALQRMVRAAVHGGVAVTIAVLAEAFFEFNLNDSEVLSLFLAVVACSYVVATKGHRDREDHFREDHGQRSSRA